MNELTDNGNYEEILFAAIQANQNFNHKLPDKAALVTALKANQVRMNREIKETGIVSKWKKNEEVGQPMRLHINHDTGFLRETEFAVYDQFIDVSGDYETTWNIVIRYERGIENLFNRLIRAILEDFHEFCVENEESLKD